MSDARVAASNGTRFGHFLVPNADAPLLETARRVEQLGLDYVGIQDHPYHRRFVDTWSLMPMIAATTTTLCWNDEHRQLERFAHEVVPAIRRQIS